MTFLTLALFAVIILAGIGLGWQTFTIAVLDGFDRTLDIAITVVKSLGLQTQEIKNTASSIQEGTVGLQVYSMNQSPGQMKMTDIKAVPLNCSTVVKEQYNSYTIDLKVPEYEICVSEWLKPIMNNKEPDRPLSTLSLVSMTKGYTAEKIMSYRPKL